MNLPSGPLRKMGFVTALMVVLSLAVSIAHGQDLPSGRWTLMPARQCSAPANQTFLNAVSWLPKAKVGFAAGACRQDPATYSPLVYQISPQSGAIQIPIYNPSYARDTILNGISADSPTDVWVAGYSDTPNRDFVNVQRSKGRAFKQITCPNPATGLYSRNRAYGVLAFAPNDVYIAGAYNESGGQGLTYLAHWDGNSCTQIPSPNPSSFDNEFYAIGGSSPQDMWLVGLYGDPGSGFIPLCVHYDGTDFEQYTCPLGPGGGSYINELVSVSVVAGGYAWAVGNSNNYGMYWGLDEYFSRDSWQPPQGHLGQCFSDVYREWGVAGVNANFAWQVAECQGTALIGFWDGQQWNPFPGPSLPSGTNSNVLMAVSARTKHTALAVGSYNIDEGPQLPFIALYTDSEAPDSQPAFQH